MIADFRWHFPTEFHLSVVLAKGLSLCQWILLEISNGLSVVFSNGIQLVIFWCVISCPEKEAQNLKALQKEGALRGPWRTPMPGIGGHAATDAWRRRAKTKEDGSARLASFWGGKSGAARKDATLTRSVR